jgi:hypothetical protein
MSGVSLENELVLVIVNVASAAAIRHALSQPQGTAIAEVVALPTQESSWP